ncbi:Complement C1q tumor necrosis factor- protein 2 [Bulinus truncatus]|nr:Complement C1q tumor necrosis factor- protein 2 [Bulinus truncatus]
MHKLNSVILIISGHTGAVSVGFSAISNNGNVLTQGQNVIFEKVLTNIGGGYDPATGIFTCPVQGLYVFNVGILSTPRSLATINLVHSGRYLISVNAYDDRNHGTGSRTVVVDCQRGDTVYAVAATPAYLFAGTANSYEHNIFSGFLVGSSMENSVSPQREFNQNQNGFGQPERGFGQPDRGFGQPERGFGQPERGFGQPQRDSGQPQREFGQPQRDFGQPERGFGQQQRDFGQRQRQ